MCVNFVVQELNRGAVINGLPAVSGKSRPMCLLTDVRPNGASNYGMTLNAFQIGSGCYNKYDMPIKIKWKSEYTTSFLSPLYALQFSQSELFQAKTTFVGILPQGILDLACSIYASYITGDVTEMDRLAIDVRNMRIEFMRTYPDTPYIDYRDSAANTIRLYPTGKEEVIAEGKPANQLRGSGNRGNEILGKSVRRITGTMPQPKAGTTKPAPKLKKEPMPRRAARPATQIPVPVHNWIMKKATKSQTNEALREFLQIASTQSGKVLAQVYGLSTRSAYVRKKMCVEELYKRVDAGTVELPDEELGLLITLEDSGKRSNHHKTKEPVL